MISPSHSAPADALSSVDEVSLTWSIFADGPCTDAAIAYVNLGLALVAIPSGQKGPRSKGWNARDMAITSRADAAKITGNIGLAHAYCTPHPTAALDIDDMALATEWLSERGVDLVALLDAENAVQIVSGRRGRAKLLYRLPADEQALRTVQIKSPATKSVVLEFRCASADGLTVQDVLPPSIHPDTGQPYRWGGKGGPARLPTMPDKVLDEWRAAMKPANQPDPGRASGLQARLPEVATELDPATTKRPVAVAWAFRSPRKVARLRQALSHISADCDYGLYRDVVWAILSTGWPDAEEIAREWCASAPDRFEERSFISVVGSFNPALPVRPGLGTLFYHAKQGGWGG